MAAKTKDLRDMGDSDLLEHFRAVRRDLFGLRFQHATGELENSAGLGAKRRELARTLTVARERGLAVERTKDQ